MAASSPLGVISPYFARDTLRMGNTMIKQKQLSIENLCRIDPTIGRRQTPAA
jgi:hypothetical protein